MRKSIMDSKIKILIGVFIIGIILIGGWWIWSLTVREKQGEGIGGGLKEDCDKLKIQSLRKQCYLKLAIQNRNSSFCDVIQSSPTKSECYRNLAKELKDKSICEKGGECGCYLVVAVETRDPLLCEYCPKDECWYIDSECHREPPKMWCYISYAGFGSKVGIETSLSDCEKIENQGIKEKCYFGFADYTNDFDLCDQISNSKWKDLCYYDVVSGIDFKTASPAICEEITDSFIKDKCYKSFACDLSRTVESICEKIVDKEIKDACYKERRRCLEPRY